MLHVTSDIHNGWNGSTSILFLFLAISASLAVIPLSLIRHVDANHKSNELLDSEEGKVGKTSETPKSNVAQEIKNVFTCLISPRMRLLICFFFFDGFQQVFVTSYFTRQVVNVGSIGTIMGIYSIVDVLFSYIHGWLSDRFGHLVVVSLATACEILGIVVSWFANAQQNWLNYATGVILAISDAGYQTEVGLIECCKGQCLSTVNQFFAENRTNANSAFRMVC